MPVLKNIGLKKNKTAVAVIAGIVIFLILFAVVLAPARKELAEKKKTWRELNAQLTAGRNKLSAFKLDKAGVEAKVGDLRKRLPSKSPTPAILEELAKKGKELNIDFISITPQPAEPLPEMTAAFNCKALPIDIKMRAAYKSLGDYLGSLDSFESSFAAVPEFRIAKDERTFPKLIVDMKVFTYTLEEAESGQE
ncbi:MAG: type 4a pilus biogenesis protein PilO [Candidatus Omnitrophica bacterium]|nr:type 4a pilus biogenesis protein PilO [Candidatus Omnitrophota bacterium]MDD5310808.1 type 4a pilus biogenesis protein PilO [Candidatus Omnitrophota bacterium]MDD5546807.1 type 4a pilus biogenesis protein PilO [Candidatus Omnitrophota bacterium]